MPLKELMKYDPRSKRWNHRDKSGRQIWRSFRQLRKAFPALVTADTKDGTREAANAFWEALEATQPPKPTLPEEYQREIELRSKMLAWFRANEPQPETSGKPNPKYQEEMEVWRKGIEQNEAAIIDLETRGILSNPPELERPEKAFWGLSQESKAVWVDRFKGLDRKAQKVSADRTISGLIKQFLNFKQSAETITPDSFEAIRCHLQILEQFKIDNEAVGNMDVATIDETFVLNFHSFLLNEKNDAEKRKWSGDYAQSVFSKFKTFVRFCWTMRKIELPRNLDEPRTFKKANKRIIVWTPEEMKQFLGRANERTQLFFMLMLNCGFYSTDISALKLSEVDWRKGRIIKKRHKTGDYENVPTVDWLLWDETFRLLKKFKADPVPVDDPKYDPADDLALRNEAGKPLRTSQIATKAGSTQVVGKRNDNVKTAFNRICRTLKIKKSAKQLRKTGPTKLDDHETFSRYSQLLLGHAPRGVEAKSYKKPSQTQFDAAVKWLGSQFGFETR